MERTSWRGADLGELIGRAERLLESGQRKILGLAGAPASGKSTLAELLLAELQRRHLGAAVAVGMDAFHIGHQILHRRGQLGVKGAPHTFDVDGYVSLLERIRHSSDTVYAPEFSREIEDSIAAAIEITPAVGLVVTEGNYLLLPHPFWHRVRPLLDEAWFLHLDSDVRRQRMFLRHQQFGHSTEDARRRTYGSDERNAQLVDAAQNNPDLWIEHLP